MSTTLTFSSTNEIIHDMTTYVFSFRSFFFEHREANSSNLTFSFYSCELHICNTYNTTASLRDGHLKTNRAALLAYVGLDCLT